MSERKDGQARGELLYNAYGDKGKLFLAAYAKYGERLLSEVQSTLDKPTPERALCDFFDFTIRSMPTGTPTRGCLTTKTAADESAHSDLIQAALKAFLADFETVVRCRLSREDAASRLVLSPADAARLVVTLTRGAWCWSASTTIQTVKKRLRNLWSVRSLSQ